jgi:hypothetical protein
VLKKTRTKLDIKSIECIFILLQRKNKNKKFYNLAPIVSSGVIFDELKKFNSETIVLNLNSRRGFRPKEKEGDEKLF